MASAPIDVWNVGTFDANLLAALQSAAKLICDYMQTDHRIFLAYDHNRGGQSDNARPTNPYAVAFYRFKDAIGREMEDRSIRAWHYTRMTDAEVIALRRDGIHLSTPESLQARLAALVATGDLSAAVSRQIYEASPLQGDQRQARSNKFWMVSHPHSIEDSRVRSLLTSWGGEGAYFGASDEDHIAAVRAIGKARVLELSIPLAKTRHSHAAGTAVIASFGRSLGCIPDKHDFDLYAVEPLGPEAVISIYSAGEVHLSELGRSYPSGFVDVNVGRWKELTGEEDD